MVVATQALVVLDAVEPDGEADLGDLTIRDRLLQLVHEVPGLNKSALRANLGVAWGTVAYHVRILVTAGLVEAQPQGRDVLLFPRGLDDQARRQASALRKPEAARVLDGLRRFREASLLQLSASIGLSRKVVRRRLEELMEAGLVHDKGLRRSRYSAVRGHLGPDLARSVAGPFGPSAPYDVAMAPAAELPPHMRMAH